MSNEGRNQPSIPLQEFVDWYNAMCDEVAGHRHQLEEVAASAPAEVRAWGYGRLHGERNVLSSFQAFITARTVDVAGGIEAYCAGENPIDSIEGRGGESGPTA